MTLLLGAWWVRKGEREEEEEEEEEDEVGEKEREVGGAEDCECEGIKEEELTWREYLNVRRGGPTATAKFE